MKKIRISFILFCCIISAVIAKAKEFPGKEWTEATPESQGISSEKLKQAVDWLSAEIGAKKSYVGGIVIIRNGYLIWSNDESFKPFGVMSVSKSFLSTGLGLMIEDGKLRLSDKVKDTDTRIAGYYPNATFRHFATMTSGYDGRHTAPHNPGYECDARGRCDSWDPGTPLEPLFAPGEKYRYWDEAEMEMSYALSLIGGNPGYVRDLLSGRIAKPIGMENFNWREIPSAVGEIPAMNGGLKTSARDLARFGLLFLNRGNWNGKQLINSLWVDEATKVQVPASVPNDVTPRAKGSGAYGYNWWVNGITPEGRRFMPGAPPGTYWASGFGTNKCFVIPAWNMVIVRTGEIPQNWNEADDVFSTFLKMIGEAIED